MDDRIDGTLRILRSRRKPDRKWISLLNLYQKHRKSALWRLLPPPNFSKDIAAARKWLAKELGKMPKSTGIYLGLDTLNMIGPGGFNVGISGVSTVKASTTDTDWIFSQSKTGSAHRIAGLLSFRRIYSAPRWEDISEDADYLLPLGYSGLILGTALTELTDTKDRVIAWGFHDGDVFLLGRRIAGKFDPIFRLSEEPEAMEVTLSASTHQLVAAPAQAPEVFYPVTVKAGAKNREIGYLDATGKI